MYPIEFPVTVFGKFERYSDTISRARCRIFYKGENRNGGFITDEFADKLLSTIAYAPVKGIYRFMDYTDHGKERSEGRIYGIVPENPNLTWENHVDEDGVTRTYACVDVLVYTSLYEEAQEIVGKGQSMELYYPSIKGDWEIINGKKLFKYTEASFLGLQVLGDDTEPCFEGASFFSLDGALEGFLKHYALYEKEIFQKQDKGGLLKVPKVLFKLSAAQKGEAIWTLLNPNYNEEGGWVQSYAVMDIYDEYAICYNCAEGIYERVYYTKDDETDSLSIGEKKRVFIVDVTESEMNALKTIQALGGYELCAEHAGEFENLSNKISELETAAGEFEQKIVEKDETIATLTTEKETAESEFTSKIEEANSQIEALQADKTEFSNKVTELEAYKLSIETAQKTALIDSYADKLDESVLEQFRLNIQESAYEALEKDLAFALVKNNPGVFSNTKTPGLVPKDVPLTGIEGILSKYKKN